MKQLILLAFLFLVACGNDNAYIASIEQEREHKNKSFKNPAQSPFKTEESLLGFEKLNYYSVKPEYRVKAHFVPVEAERPYPMAATGDETDTYVEYGTLTFELHGEQLELTAFKNLDANEVFIPFKDATSAKETYGGGRYLDISVPHAEQDIDLDFNKAYNPYCAYNSDYSCPIPPRVNWLEVPIEAGEMNYDY